MSDKAPGEMEALSRELSGCSAVLWDGGGQSRVSGVSWRAKGGPCGGGQGEECCSMLWEKEASNIASE